MDEKEKDQQQPEGCSSDCSNCASAGSCGSQPHSLLEETNSFNDIKKVIAIVRGNGGVGKSLVTSLMAVNMQRKGYRTSILDADITGPSIPKAFGLTAKAFGNKLGILPVRTKTGIGTMSVNNLLENDTEPVLWRGSVNEFFCEDRLCFQRQIRLVCKNVDVFFLHKADPSRHFILSPC